MRTSGPLPRVLEALNESAESSLRRRSSESALTLSCLLRLLMQAAFGMILRRPCLNGMESKGNICLPVSYVLYDALRALQ